MTLFRKAGTPTLMLAICLAAETASACPMCKAAAEADSRLPTAFLTSILFMLAVPFSLATAFGVAFYRLSQQRPGHDEPPANDSIIESSDSSNGF